MSTQFLTKVFLFLCLFIMVYSWSQPAFTYQPFCSLGGVVDIKSTNDGRMFLVRQAGNVRIANPDGSLVAGDFINISTILSTGSERGLLGLAFHPDFENNGYFYLNYTGFGGHTRIARYQVSSTNPNQADPSSAYILMTINQDFANHNGGHLAFGPDGYLYIGMGDGGSGGDPNDRAQDPTQLLGKMLRIDVNNADPGLNYAIPPTNPFVGITPYRPEIWAMGMRNPWKFTFDRFNHNLWIADVGQNAWEEVNIEYANSGGGFNYGWDCYEGSHSYEPAGCGDAITYTDPIFEYPHSGGGSITGGYVYRGSDIPQLQGWYMCADFVTSDWYLLQPDGTGGSLSHHLPNFFSNSGVTCFGEDSAGEIYFSNVLDGTIYKLTDPCTNFMTTSTLIPETCDNMNGSINLLISGGQSPYSTVWSNGATTQNISGLSAGNYSVAITDALGCNMNIDTLLLNYCSGITLQLKLYLQGPYNSGGLMTNDLNGLGLLPLSHPYSTIPWNYPSQSINTMPTDIVDWLYIQLRAVTAPESVIAQAVALLHTDGTVTSNDGISPVLFSEVEASNYYVAIYHRNHLAVITKQPVTFPQNGILDLTGSSNSVLGNEQLVELELGIYGMIAGDYDGNGVINAVDYNVWAINNAIINNYSPQDGNLSGVVNALDYNLWVDEPAKIGHPLIQY